MTPIEIIEQILKDNRELEKSTRYYNQTAKQRAEAMVHQRSELKLLNIPHVVNCDHEWVMTHSGYCRDCVKCGRKE